MKDNVQIAQPQNAKGFKSTSKTLPETMSMVKPEFKPLVSVIITCYNHGGYLAEAIESVTKQNLENIEIVVVDDGSTDNTKDVALSYPGVKYVYQHNQGLSAARNTGVNNSTGSYLVFLDADDWLLPDSLTTNIRYLEQNKNAAFVSGAYKLFHEKNGIVEHVRKTVEEDHYYNLVRQGNFIGMHAAVMFRRWVFDFFRYDTSLRACEDYDIYLNITRSYPVFHHADFIATYRMHDTNMSGNSSMMLETALKVLGRQKQYFKTGKEKSLYQKGVNFWEEYYCRLLYKSAIFTKPRTSVIKKHEYSVLWKHRKKLFIKYIIKKLMMPKMDAILNVVPNFILRWFHKAGLFGGFIPSYQRVSMGDFKRVRPFSDKFGFDRGGPVDRFYIENFLQQESASIKGRVLEIADNAYTLKFGTGVTQSDILHIDDTNPNATLVGDLSDAPHIPDNSFDCIILTQTLHLIYDFKAAVNTCYRILKPGGVLLLTVPGITQIDKGDWYKYWLWSFTETSMKRIFSEVFPVEKTAVEPYGNVLVATAFLYGMGLPELKKEHLEYQDPHYQVIITVAATK